MPVWLGTEAPLTNIMYQNTLLSSAVNREDDLIYGRIDLSEIHAVRHFDLQRVVLTKDIVSIFMKEMVTEGHSWD